jgi:8-amino-3,8-dideoxy-alpha-D-manno-octulosonate transaminase
MTELTAAVLLAQFRKMGAILTRLRANKQRFRSALANVAGLEFREITDPGGECATLLTLFLPNEEIARKVATELDTKVVADSGWHVYANMEQILEKRTPTAEGWPDRHPLYVKAGGSTVRYWRGMLPQTDRLLSRAINISIGVSDAGLGSACGVTMHDGAEEVDACAERVRQAIRKWL